MAAESFRERQEDELQVLKSVYMEDVVDLRERDSWKVSYREISCPT